jgi:hypothetical protein
VLPGPTTNAFLARYSSRTLDAYRHDLRNLFQWAACPVLEPAAELRPTSSRDSLPPASACRCPKIPVRRRPNNADGSRPRSPVGGRRVLGIVGGGTRLIMGQSRVDDLLRSGASSGTPSPARWPALNRPA